MTQKPFDPPAIFDSKGQFVEWSESVLEQAPRHIVEAYDDVHEYADDLVVIEYELAETEKALHAAVAELRIVEHEISQAPRVTQQMLVRDMIETQRRFG